MRARRTAAAGAVLVAALLLAGCSDADDSTQPVPPAPSDTPMAEPEPQPDLEDADPPAPKPPADCDNLISPSLDATLRDQGWTPRTDRLFAGNVEVTDGVLCVWGDFSSPNDHVQLYGYGEADAEAQQAMQADLEGQGWKREEDGDRVLFTQPKASIRHADEDGYGLTYEFGDGWVRYADTKQSLLLIQYP